MSILEEGTLDSEDVDRLSSNEDQETDPEFDACPSWSVEERRRIIEPVYLDVFGLVGEWVMTLPAVLCASNLRLSE
jgi:hypothetical protein